MKPNHLFTSTLAVTALFVASCSTPKTAQHNAIQDDVYNTTAQAKEYIAPAPRPTAVQYQEEVANADNYDSYYGTSDPYYDMDYSSRIDRFYYASPWRSYFGYNDFYGYNSFYSPYSFGFGGYYDNFYNYGFNSYLNWGLYGNYPYFSNFWGPYSWNNPYGGWGGGWGWGGGFYGGGFVGGGTNANYRPRPSRGSENGVGRANGMYLGGGSSRATGTNNNPNVGRSRAEMYNPATNGVSRANGNASNGSSRANGNMGSAPSRGDNGSMARPTRSNDAPQQSRPTYNPPPAQSSPPPSSRGGGSSSSGGGGGGGGGRPTRGGR